MACANRVTIHILYIGKHMHLKKILCAGWPIQQDASPLKNTLHSQCQHNTGIPSHLHHNGKKKPAGVTDLDRVYPKTVGTRRKTRSTDKDNGKGSVSETARPLAARRKGRKHLCGVGCPFFRGR